MSTCSVKLLSVGNNKIAVIKAVREITGLGLKEAKELVEGRGIVAENLTRRAAERITVQLASVGAKSGIEPTRTPQPQPKPEPVEPEPAEDRRDGAYWVLQEQSQSLVETVENLIKRIDDTEASIQEVAGTLKVVSGTGGSYCASLTGRYCRGGISVGWVQGPKTSLTTGTLRLVFSMLLVPPPKQHPKAGLSWDRLSTTLVPHSAGFVLQF